MLALVLSLLIAVASGWYAFELAGRKGRHQHAWMIATVLFLLPLLILLILPSAKDKDSEMIQAA